MIAPALAILGAALLVACALLLRSLGPRYRVGRLLSATPLVTIDDAVDLARTGESSYVRVQGRITSDEEFPDDNDRPLVFRRTRIEVQRDGRWIGTLDEREAVPFGVEARSQFIAVDESALGAGLVVIPREAEGRVADLPADLTESLPAGVTPDVPARLVIEQLSAVEHATVCGVPAARSGVPMMTAGLGRPLIVTMLEEAAAMRVLAGDQRGRVVLAAVLLVGGFGALAAAVAATLLGY